MARIKDYFPGIPVLAMTLPDNPGLSRLQVDVAETGFFAGRQFRMTKELSITSTPLIVRYTVPETIRGAILQGFILTCYTGGIRMRAFRSGTPGGSFTPEQIFPNNGFPELSYTGVVTMDSGGTLSGASAASETVVALSNPNGAGASSNESILPGQRGLAPGVYYLEFTPADGVSIGTSKGIASWLWEEVPLAT